jgi:CHAD domain
VALTNFALVKPLKKLIASHLKKYNAYLKLVEGPANEDPIHDQRVEYKKIRALARLTTTSSNKIKIPATLKELYAAEGHVRELQLQLQHMKEMEDCDKLPDYFNLLNRQLSFALNTLKEKLNSKDLKKSIKGFDKKIPAGISSKNARRFINQKAAALLLILELRNKKDEDIHTARKIIKDLMYSFNTIKLLGLSPVIRLSEEEEKQFHRLSDELGLYQDQCNALALLKLSMFRNLPEAEKKILKEIRAKKMALKIEERKKVLTALNNSIALFTKIARY